MPERHVDIATPDGAMPAFMAVPEGAAPCPVVFIYMDVFGPREELNDICRRFAAAGHAAIIPHLFHRLGSPVFAPVNRREDKMEPEAHAANMATTLEHSTIDTKAMIDAVDGGLLGVNAASFGAIGYCMGGRHALAAATAYPDRIGAGLSVHGGQLVRTTNDSAHLLISRLNVPFFFAFAKNDVTCPDEHQELVRQEAARTGDHVVCQQFAAHHGWSFPDRWCHDHETSEAIYRKALQMFSKG
jgi:carboxymethylenebutenolidase